MKQAFTTNWEIYRVCLSATYAPKPQHTTQHSPQNNQTFEQLLLQAVDEELTSLGNSVKKTIYYHLKQTFKIDRQDIPHNIDQFAQALEQIFGTGAKFLEIGIMKRLHDKAQNNIDYLPEENDLIFTEYIKAAEQSNQPY